MCFLWTYNFNSFFYKVLIYEIFFTIRFPTHGDHLYLEVTEATFLYWIKQVCCYLVFIQFILTHALGLDIHRKIDRSFHNVFSSCTLLVWWFSCFEFDSQFFKYSHIIVKINLKGDGCLFSQCPTHPTIGMMRGEGWAIFRELQSLSCVKNHCSSYSIG